VEATVCFEVLFKIVFLLFLISMAIGSQNITITWG
jgi:hypothetical protein